MVKKYMIWNKKFEYPTSIRSLINDQRHYDIGEENYPQLQQSYKQRNLRKRRQYWLNGSRMLAK
jgi:hypothetical protein